MSDVEPAQARCWVLRERTVREDEPHLGDIEPPCSAFGSSSEAPSRADQPAPNSSAAAGKAVSPDWCPPVA